jgi:hypothetical protein
MLLLTFSTVVLRFSYMPQGESQMGKQKPHKKKAVRITLSADDLSALTRHVTPGNVLLQTDHPVLTQLKKALTRMGIPRPPGREFHTRSPRFP